ncbi:MAG TPA: hypothetical protein PKA79_04475 [Oligoflexia bacterium]|nr:hypothetical protein [Oligoflexia bacterium]
MRLLGFIKNTIILMALTGQLGCGIIRKKEENSFPPVKEIITTPLSAEEHNELLRETTRNIFYGEALGRTAVAAGSTIVFPPAALYWLGNLALDLAGYETIGPASFMPPEAGKEAQSLYVAIVSAPGRIVATAAGQNFRDQKSADQKIKNILEKKAVKDQADPLTLQSAIKTDEKI